MTLGVSGPVGWALRLSAARDLYWSVRHRHVVSRILIIGARCTRPFQNGGAPIVLGFDGPHLYFLLWLGSFVRLGRGVRAANSGVLG